MTLPAYYTTCDALGIEDDYDKRLIAAIIDHGSPHGPIQYDSNAGSIYVCTGDLDVYATPFWEGELDGLPVNVVDAECDIVYDDWIDVRWTGDVATDVQKWNDVIGEAMREISLGRAS